MFAAALASGNFHEGDLELGARPTFALARLQELDRAAPHPLQLDGSFGDGALLGQLAPYRRIRERLVALDYRFLPIEQLTPAERAAPELRLLKALRTRSIPYRQMRFAFDEFVSSSPTVRFDDRGLPQVCMGSTTPHEGAHALVYEAVLAAERTLAGERAVEALITGEGFAIAFELWLALLLMNQRRRSTPIFFSLNAAQSPFALHALELDGAGTLARLGALAETKPAAVMKVLAAAGLIANVRPNAKSVRPALVRHLSACAGLTETHATEATTLIGAALGLDDEFRTTTAQTFFRFNDLEAAHHALLERPLEYFFEPGAIFNDHLDGVISMVAGNGTAT